MAGEESDDAVLVIDPIHQFELHSIFSDRVGNFSFTNSSVWMLITAFCIIAFFAFAWRGRDLIPGRLQCVSEMLYEFTCGMIRDICGDEGMKFFPYIFSLFMFVLFANILGMLPTSFTVTSHIAVTGCLAMGIFIAITLLGFVRHGIGFLHFFVPKDAPLLLKPFLAVVELISYFVRPVSHSIRLSANMVAGHAMIKVFAGFASVIAIYGVSFGTTIVTVGSVLVLVAVIALEILVACLQAYVFAVLTCVYLNDALHMH